MSGTAPAASPTSLFRRLLRMLALAALVLVPLLAVAAWMALQPPSWWHPGARGDAAAADRAAAFEQSIVSAFTRVRPDEPEWAIRIQASEVNDWLATRLPAWLESRGEPVPVAVQARMQPGRVTVGVDLRHVVAWWQASAGAREGGVRVQATGGGVGRLPIALVPSVLDRQWDRSGLEAPIRLADGRLVRVLDVELLQDEVRLRLRTEPRPAGR
jgi:hypothetical protein